MASTRADEYTVYVPKLFCKKYNVMQFNSGDRVDIRVRLHNFCLA